MERQRERRREAEPIMFSRALEERYRMQQEARQKLSSLPRVAKYSEVPWEQNAQAYVKYYTGTTMRGRLDRAPICSMTILEQMLFPGSHSGKHRHLSEEVHKILEGQGYDLHDGQRWDWEAEDAVFIPINTVHQHFNTDPYRPARFVSFQSRLFHYVGHGGIEHFEDAPDYRP